MDMNLLLDSMWMEVPIVQFTKPLAALNIKAQFGIIAKKSDGDESWKAYTGVVMHQLDEVDLGRERKDIEAICKTGKALSEEQARAFFPNIKLKYRG
jgi:hypothetical protein